MRIGQRPLQRVVLAPQRIAEGSKIGVHHFQTTRIMAGERVAALDDMQRGLMLGPGFSEQQRAMLEVDRKLAQLARYLDSHGLPPKTAGDHQMEHEKELAIRFEHDPLSESVQIDDPRGLAR